MVNFSLSGFSVSNIIQRVISFFTGKAIEQVEKKVHEKSIKKARDKAILDDEKLALEQDNTVK